MGNDGGVPFCNLLSYELQVNIIFCATEDFEVVFDRKNPISYREWRNAQNHFQDGILDIEDSTNS